ncbi:MAG: pilus assembly protein PilM [Patescibacteria group bacterium]
MSVSSVRCALSTPRKQTFLERWFPMPGFLAPETAGVDISDSSVKWLSFIPGRHGLEVRRFAQATLEPGIVVEGIVQSPERLSAALVALQKEAKGTPAAHGALPEELGFVFTMHVGDARMREQVLKVIEFELEDRVPLKVNQAVYDYDIILPHPDGIGAEIGVTVFPTQVAEGYAAAFEGAGIALHSLEMEASSVARSVLPPNSKDVVLVVDFGRARTGIAIMNRGVPIFTSTVAVGGDAMTKALVEQMGVDEVKAEEIKNEQGISRSSDPKVITAVQKTADALASEIARHYEYWDTRRNEHGNKVTPVSQILLTGGSANLKGLDEFIAGKAKAPTIRAGVWQNVCSFEEYIPPIDRHHALGLSTAIGLALRGA